jgi:hypothetical protein
MGSLMGMKLATKLDLLLGEQLLGSELSELELVEELLGLQKGSSTVPK